MCTKVCPTCYCFDVNDEVDLKLQKGKRVRVWDSCQIEKFAVVAGGHNFRTRRALRQRHRFMRKGKYQFEAYGLMGCVGCGRCAEACLVHITPVDTYNALFREQHPDAVAEPVREVQS
jgi:Fe-S oxidoreductase